MEPEGVLHHPTALGRVLSDTRLAVENYLTAINAHNPDAIARCVSEDFVNEHTSEGGTSLTGRAAYRQRLEGFLSTFRELHYQLEDVIVDGQRAAVPYRMSFVWSGEDGVDRPVMIRGMFSFRVADGEITHRVDYWDSAAFDRQVNR